MVRFYHHEPNIEQVPLERLRNHGHQEPAAKPLRIRVLGPCVLKDASVSIAHNREAISNYDGGAQETCLVNPVAPSQLA